MCGIAGAVWNDASGDVDRERLRAMTDAILHRGPDDEGLLYRSWQECPVGREGQRSGVALGFRRLSIIDLATGHQPLGNEDDSIQIVFNGEIYNYQALRRRLEGAGHRFKTQTDTETIVHLYEDYGLDCFAMLNGMFAIALWDAPRQRLVLARDRLGKKPLYYTQQVHRLAFGSELKCLMQLPDTRRRLDPEALDLYFTYQYIPHPHTIYQGIHKLPPGHAAVWENGRLEISRYWDIDWSKEVPRTQSQAIEEVRELLTDAVRLRLRSDVPLGAFLSGGVDSSLIVALAQKQLKEPIRTFAIGFAETDFDETAYAQAVADSVGTRHERFQVEADAVSILDRLVYHYDEPFSDSSAVPTWYLCQQTRQAVTVALSGDGGDELFAGYERYHALQWSESVQAWTPLTWMLQQPWLARWPSGQGRRSFMRRVQRFAEALGEPAARRYLRFLQIFNESQRGQMYRPEFIERLPDRDPFTFLDAAWQASRNRDLIAKASTADLQTYLPCDLMTKVDIASMAHSLEARQPFLDYRLVEWAAALPTPLKYRWRRGKRLLQDAFGDLLPQAIWHRKKMGFGVPLGPWFRGPLRGLTRDLLLGDDARCHAFLRAEAISDLWDRHQSGQSNEGYRLWNLLFLEKWLRRWNPE